MLDADCVDSLLGGVHASSVFGGSLGSADVGGGALGQQVGSSQTETVGL